MNTNLQDMDKLISHLFPHADWSYSEVKPIYGGRNNRAYFTKINGHAYFLKHYNAPIDLERSRLQAEYTFLSYAKQCDCPHVASPVLCDENLSVGVYDYIQGCKFNKDEIGQFEIDQALKFLIQINQFRFSSQAKDITYASEACFSMDDHIKKIDARVERVKSISICDEVDKKAVCFVEKKLIPAWQTVKSTILAELKTLNRDPGQVLLMQNRIISPSDFGFHNALKDSHNQIRFVDFEYAGWDDPAKLVADFFNQIDVPVPLSFFTHFTEMLASVVQDKEEMIRRSRLLLPAYKIKWICIVLNYFINASKVQKDFVSKVTVVDKTQQLDKANAILQSLDEWQSMKG